MLMSDPPREKVADSRRRAIYVAYEYVVSASGPKKALSSNATLHLLRLT